MPTPASQDWNAASYHRISGPQFAWGMRVLDKIALHGDETIIDAGCGTGLVTAEILKQLPDGHVIAIDASPSMLAAARETLAPFGERVSFMQADLLDIGLTDVADGVFSTATFHWVPDHLRLFRNLYQALRSGGWLVAQCGGKGNLARLRQRADDLAATPDFAPYFIGWGELPQRYEADLATAERLRSVGFSDVVTSLEERPTTFPDRQIYSEFIATVALKVHVEQLPDEDTRAKFVDAIADLAAQDDPPFTLDYWRLNISARK
jgi:trans-aconitate 2-methyltransferase